MVEERICQKCGQRPFTKMILWNGVIPKFICDECDNELLKDK